MAALTIKLPDALARASTEMAQSLGMTPSELIRQALIHELEHLEASQERQAIAESLRAMAKDERYLDETLAEPLDDEGNWWRG